jgi:hypothetical protein
MKFIWKEGNDLTLSQSLFEINDSGETIHLCSLHALWDCWVLQIKINDNQVKYVTSKVTFAYVPPSDPDYEKLLKEARDEVQGAFS